MLSVRTLARSAPRAVSRMAAASSLRAPAAARAGTLARSSSATLSALRPSRATFSTTVGRRAADGEVDDELSAKLESEIQIEGGMADNEQLPTSVKDFLENSPFELEDTPGTEVVKLTRAFGDEKITVSFSIADVTDYDAFNDPAFDDEDMSGGEGSLQGSIKAGGRSNASARSAEEQPDEDEDEDVDDDESSAPINLSIVVEKPSKSAGALSIDATAQDGHIVVDNVFFYQDSKVARVDSPEAAQRRADVYPGPPFGSLDEDLQVLVERFLEERGVTQALAVFVPDYVDVKEQREYLAWLNNVKAFVDA